MQTGRKIRVAFFAEILLEELDGATRTMFQLLRRIDRTQFEFLFFCAVGPKQIQGFPCVHLPALTLPMNQQYKMVLPFLAKKKLQEELETFKADVIHIATPSLLGQFAAKYAAQHYIPVLTIYHTHFISYIDSYLAHAPFLIPAIRGQLLQVQKSFYNLCGKIYVPSESIAQELLNSGIDASRLQLWKRGIDTSLFSPHKRLDKVMHVLTRNKRKNILFVSRLVWEKNLATLFRIYDLVEELNLPYNLVVVGDGLARKDCEARMPHAFFTGRLSHDSLAPVYASADVFVFPSVTETYGNVVLEAMASGLPCVIADGGGSRDLIRHGENGFRCAPYDAHDYVEKIQSILERPGMAQHFIQQGLLLSASLDWEKLAETYFLDLQHLAFGTIFPVLTPA